MKRFCFSVTLLRLGEIRSRRLVSAVKNVSPRRKRTSSNHTLMMIAKNRHCYLLCTHVIKGARGGFLILFSPSNLQVLSQLKTIPLFRSKNIQKILFILEKSNKITKTNIIQRIINLYHSGYQQTNTLANSEDPDEMLH